MLTYIQADLMGAWRVPTNVSGLISAGARWGSVYKGLGPSRQIAFDLVEVAGWVVLQLEVDTYNGWYWLCDILIYFWLKFCFDRWLSSVRGRAIVHIQKSIVPSSSSCVYVAVCADRRVTVRRIRRPAPYRDPQPF